MRGGAGRGDPQGTEVSAASDQIRPTSVRRRVSTWSITAPTTTRVWSVSVACARGREEKQHPSQFRFPSRFDGRRDLLQSEQAQVKTHASKMDVKPAVLFPTERHKLVLHVLFRRLEVPGLAGKVGEILDERRFVAADLAASRGVRESSASVSLRLEITRILDAEGLTSQRCQSC